MKPRYTALLLLATTLSSCRLTLVQTDCLEVIASKIDRDGGRVTAQRVQFRTLLTCKPIQAVAYRAYRERNEVPGFQPNGQPPDILVDRLDADNGGQPSHELSISNLDNEGHAADFADSWEITVTYPDGDQSVFSGNF